MFSARITLFPDENKIRSRNDTVSYVQRMSIQIVRLIRLRREFGASRQLVMCCSYEKYLAHLILPRASQRKTSEIYRSLRHSSPSLSYRIVYYDSASYSSEKTRIREYFSLSAARARARARFQRSYERSRAPSCRVNTLSKTGPA